MKKILLFVLVLIVGCATDTYESLIKDMISTFEEMRQSTYNIRTLLITILSADSKSTN